jgi:putative transposase
MGLRNRTRLLDYHCFFITTTCHKFLPLLEPEAVKKIIIENLIFYNKKYNCKVICYVIMPEHIHMILYFEGENKLIEYMRDFKKYSSVQIRRLYQDAGDPVVSKLKYKYRTQDFKVWKDRFDDVFLYSRRVILIKVNYIHQNPVKAGLCEKADDYRYSSASFYKNGEFTDLEILHVEEIL